MARNTSAYIQKLEAQLRQSNFYRNLYQQAYQAATAGEPLEIRYSPDIPQGTLAVTTDTLDAEKRSAFWDGFDTLRWLKERWLDRANDFKSQFAEQRGALDAALKYGRDHHINDAIEVIAGEISKLLDKTDVLNRECLNETGYLALDAQSFMELRDRLAEYRAGSKTLEELAKIVLETEDAIPVHLWDIQPPTMGPDPDLDRQRMYECSWHIKQTTDLQWGQVAIETIKHLEKRGHKSAAQKLKSMKNKGRYLGNLASEFNNKK